MHSSVPSSHTSPIPIPSPPHDDHLSFFSTEKPFNRGDSLESYDTTRSRGLSDETLDDIIATMGSESSAFAVTHRGMSTSFAVSDESGAAGKRPSKASRTLWQNVKVSGRPDKLYSSFRQADKSVPIIGHKPLPAEPAKQREVATVTSTDTSTKKLQRAFRVLSPHSESEESGSGDFILEDDFMVSGGGVGGLFNAYRGVHQPSAASIELAEVAESTWNEELLRLPVGWGSRVDESSGRRYYYNITTGQSTWDKPGLLDVSPPSSALAMGKHATGHVSASQAGALITVVFNSSASSSPHSSPMTSPLVASLQSFDSVDTLPGLTRQSRSNSQHTRPLPDGWRQLFDPSSGEHMCMSAGDCCVDRYWHFDARSDLLPTAIELCVSTICCCSQVGITITTQARASQHGNAPLGLSPPQLQQSQPRHPLSRIVFPRSTHALRRTRHHRRCRHRHHSLPMCAAWSLPAVLVGVRPLMLQSPPPQPKRHNRHQLAQTRRYCRLHTLAVQEAAVPAERL